MLPVFSRMQLSVQQADTRLWGTRRVLPRLCCKCGSVAETKQEISSKKWGKLNLHVKENGWRKWCNFKMHRNPWGKFHFTLNFGCFCVYSVVVSVPVRVSAGPHYAAESLSWYSRDRSKHAWTPLSAHSLRITPPSSADITPSSAELARANSWRASSWTKAATSVAVPGGVYMWAEAGLTDRPRRVPKLDL